MPAIESVSRELSLEIQRTFDYFASTPESERIGKIVLSGGCAKLAGIEDFLASSWGVPVELAQSLQRDRLRVGTGSRTPTCTRSDRSSRWPSASDCAAPGDKSA